MSAPTIRSIRVAGAEVRYEVHGDGPRAVVLIHGWGSDRVVWRTMLAAPMADARIVAIDLAGHGESDVPADGDHSLAALARGVIAVLDAERLDRVTLVGHSMGAPVAASVVAQLGPVASRRVAGIVALDGNLWPMPINEWQRGMMARLRGDGYDEVIALFAQGLPTSKAPPEAVEAQRTAMRRTARAVVIGTLDSSLDPAAFPNAPIGAPVLLIKARTAFDREPEAEVRSRLALLHPGSLVEYWEGVTHFLLAEEPARVWTAIRGFGIP